MDHRLLSRRRAQPEDGQSVLLSALGSGPAPVPESKGTESVHQGVSRFAFPSEEEFLASQTSHLLFRRSAAPWPVGCYSRSHGWGFIRRQKA